MTRIPGLVASRHTIYIALTALVMFFGAGSAFAGTCTSAVLEEAFVLPDGTERPAGTLTLCVERTFSPVQSLHRISVDGMPIGMALSRHSTTELPDARTPAMVFERAADDRLYLLGYVSPGRDQLKVFAMRPKVTLDPERIAEAISGNSTTPTASASTAVVIAAILN